MSTIFNDMPVVKNCDFIGELYRLNTLCDQQHCTFVENHIVKLRIYFIFRYRIKRSGWLIKEEYYPLRDNKQVRINSSIRE